jgi:metal-dependent amidase/aminoacylase/carboxypeptidase family protein
MISDAEILAAVEERREVLRRTIRFVHEHPELGHEEHRCCTYLCTTLAGAGLEVEQGIAGMDTAFLAKVQGGRPGRSVGLVCLYDAVPAMRPDGRIEAVHSCGHGPIAAGVTTAALALAGLREKLAGSVAVVGCPADEIHAPGTIERGGGKALSAEAGVWDGMDAALYAHPEFIDTVTQQSLWMRRDLATVSGTRSLSGAQQAALDAAAAATRLERPGEIMLERLLLDGDVEDGTGAVARATFLVWATDQRELEARVADLHAALPGASWEEGRLVQGVRHDLAVAAAVADAFRAAGRDFVEDPPPLPFATDFGNISQRVPAALIGVGHENGWAFHTDEGAAQFTSTDGEEAALVLARVLALAAARLVAEPIG